MQTTLTNVSIGVFIDGGYYAKVNQNFENDYSMRIGIGEFLQFIKRHTAETFRLDPDACKITERHIFQGRFRAHDAEQRDLLFKERKFEDSLIEADVVFHYKHLRTAENNPRQVIEKGIDVWFALEAYELTLARELDIVVLITGDGDHEMLLNKIKALKRKAVLLTWNNGPVSSTSRSLQEEASLHIEMGTLVKNNPRLIEQFSRKP